ncbi:MAG TPA: FtsX-like permease family protein [Thermoplasmata archaeon]
MDPAVTLLLVIVAVVGLGSLAIAARARLPWRLALRNVRRGRWRTVLVIFGLLIATTIVSGSLVIGDTVSAVNVHFTYEAFGFTDEAIYNQSPSAGYLFFPYGVYTQIAAGAGGDPDIAGIAPEIVTPVQVLDLTSHVPQPGLNLVGADANTTGALGSFTASDGTRLAGPGPGEAYLDVLAAQEVNASVGDHLRLYGPSAVPAVVTAIVNDDTRGSFLFGGNVFVDLGTAQAMQNASGLVNFLAVTNAGSLVDGVALSGSVSAHLNATLAGLSPEYGLVVAQLLHDNLQEAETAGQSLVQLFLVLGLFSIVAGSMLIVGIFVMLAEERKGEMGMLRAIGLRRRQLILTYYFEGLVYSAGSAAAGTVLGVGVGYGLTYAFSQLFATSVVSSQAILASFSVVTSSLVIAYVVGFLLTLATVAVASFRVSRLNIVRAIRNMPEPTPTLRTYTFLAYAGVAVLVVGGLLFASTYQGTSDISVPLSAGGALIGGAALVGSRFVRNRIVFSLAGAALVVWGGFDAVQRPILGSHHTGTILSLFVAGILMVVGAILLYAFNAATVVAAASALTGRRPRTVSVVRIGLSYPARRSFRTAINLTIFSLVLFTVVSVASFGASLQGNLDNTILSESGGYTFFGSSNSPIPDLPGLVAQNASTAPLFSNVVPLVSGGAFLNFSGAPSLYPYPVFAAPANASGSSDFYTTNAYNFSSTLGGLSDRAVFDQLRTDPTVALVDGQFSPQSGGFGPAHPTLSVGSAIDVLNPDNGAHRSLTVIGVLAQSFVNGVWLNPVTAGDLGYHNESAFLLTVAPGVSSVHAAQVAKAAFFPFGLVLFEFAEILRTSFQSTQAVIGLLEIFVALGLAVGIAAMGIVALRAVTERRGEIGMLRATGFTRGMILRVFLLEYSYVSLLGIGIGTALAIVLIYSASQSSGGLLAFTVPWANIALVLLASYALTVAAILGPSLKASRLPPAEAIRHAE